MPELEYSVEWGMGPLGLTLRPDLGEDMPPVVGRITRLDSAAARAGVSIGHLLINVNGYETASKGYDQIVSLLQNTPRPIILKFRIPRTLQSKQKKSFSATLSSSSSLSNTNIISTKSSTSLRKKKRKENDKKVNNVSNIELENDFIPINSNKVTIIDTLDRINEEHDNKINKKKREYYSIIWKEGPLGMIFRPDQKDPMIASIRKITGKGSSSGIEKARTHDLLVAINGEKTREMDFHATISLLKAISKPVVLKFKRTRRSKRSRNESSTFSMNETIDKHKVKDINSIPMDENHNKDEIGVYDIVWREGELGLKLKPGGVTKQTPIVSRLTGKGNASGLHNSCVNDELIYVNGKKITHLKYIEVLKLLKKSKKPAILRFRPSHNKQENEMNNTSLPYAMTNKDNINVNKMKKNKTVRDNQNLTEKHEKISLDVAKELICTSKKLNPLVDKYAGILIQDIEDGSREADLLQREANVYVMRQAAISNHKDNVGESLSRAEKEKQILAEALEKVKRQAKEYQEMLLQEQKKKKILSSVTAGNDKSEDIIGRQNLMIKELVHVISDFRRESYSDANEYVLNKNLPENEEDPEDQIRQSMMEDLESIMALKVPENFNNVSKSKGTALDEKKCCNDCGVTSSESDLKLDNDGEYYCTKCWDRFYSTENQRESQIKQNSFVAPDSHLSSILEHVGHGVILEEDEGGKAVEEDFTSGTKNNSDNIISFNNSVDINTNYDSKLYRHDEAEKNLSEKVDKHLQLDDIDECSNIQKNTNNSLIIGTEHINNPIQPIESEEEDTTKKNKRRLFKKKTFSLGNIKRNITAKFTNKNSDALKLPDSPQSPHPTTPDEDKDFNHESRYDNAVEKNDVEDDTFSSIDEEERLLQVKNDNFLVAKQLEEAHEVVERIRMSFVHENGLDDEIMEASGNTNSNHFDSSVGLSEEQIQLFKKLTVEAEENKNSYYTGHNSDSDYSDVSGHRSHHERQGDSSNYSDQGRESVSSVESNDQEEFGIENESENENRYTNEDENDNEDDDEDLWI